MWLSDSVRRTCGGEIYLYANQLPTSIRGALPQRLQEKLHDPEEGQLSKLQKKLLKKLHQIEALERAQMSGQTLEKTQLEKVAKKAELWREFEAASSCH